MEQKTFSYDEAYAQSLEYFGGDDLATKVYLDKYALKDKKENILEPTPYYMHKRIAKEFARIEKDKFKRPLTEDEVFAYLDHFNKIIPGGSPMFGIGNPYQITSLSNCFAIESPEDSYGGIFKADEQLAQICKRRGGVGLELSNLRPEGTETNNAAKTSTGVNSFQGRFSRTVSEVCQGGRRGASMQGVSIQHPESVKLLADDEAPQMITIKNEDEPDKIISTEFYNPKNLDFASIKQDKKNITSANISIRISDEFMNAVKKDKMYTQQWPIECDNPVVTKKINAKKAWKKIIYNAWSCLSPDTKLIIEEDKETRRISIEELVTYLQNNPYAEVYILSLNKDTLKIDKNKITGVQKHKNDKESKKITFSIGSSVNITSDHDLYRYVDGKVESVKAGKLSNGDKVLFSKNNIRSQNASIINLFETGILWEGGYKWNHKDIKTFLNNKKVISVLGRFSNGYSRAKQYNESKNVYIPGPDMKKLYFAGLIGKGWTFSEPRKDNIRDPSHFVSPNFAEFLGLTLAEGNIHDNSIRLHINTSELQYYIPLLDEISKEFSGTYNSEFEGDYCCVYVQCSFLTQLVRSLLFYDGDKCVPLFLYSSSDVLLGRFLRGLFNGDGTVDDNGVISLYQSRPNVIDKVNELLLSFGIFSYTSLTESAGKKMICGKECNTKDGYQLTVYGQFNKNFVKYIGFGIAEKSNKIKLDKISSRFHCPINANRKLFNKFLRRGQIRQDYVRLSSITRDNRLFNDPWISNFINSDCYAVKVKNIDNITLPYVYDITVDKTHTFVLANGLCLSNCAEPGVLYWDTIIRESISDCYAKLGFKTIITNPCGEIPLNPYGSCLLMSMNLFTYVKNPFTKDAYFDYDEFYKDAQILQRLMDDLVDLEKEAINKIIDKIKKDPEQEETKSREIQLWKNILDVFCNGRRTGSGATGLGDTLAALGIKYASSESIKVTDKIYKTLKLGCYRSSVDIAKELGAFPIWDFNLEKDNIFLLRIKDEDTNLWNDNKKYGRRNIAILTSAPDGTRSIVAQVTSGIEPMIFLKPYTRRKKINPNDKNSRADFTDQDGNQWQEFQVFPAKVEMWKNITKETDINKSPWAGSTAQELEWIGRVKLQSVAQKHICHSISSTINLPADITVEKVAEIYETAWEMGCKGVTIYRDGCRSGVMINKKEKKNVIPKTNAPKRPERLPCDVHHIKVTKRLDKVRHFEYIVAVGLYGDNNEPYEVFAFENGQLDKKYEKGYLVKKARGKYDIEFDDGKKIVNIMKEQTEEEEVITRSISMSLRHGTDISFVVHQFEKVGKKSELMGSFVASIVKALKKYIKDDIHITGEDCPTCSKNGIKNTLIRQSGCVQCTNCPYSLCSG